MHCIPLVYVIIISEKLLCLNYEWYNNTFIIKSGGIRFHSSITDIGL